MESFRDVVDLWESPESLAEDLGEKLGTVQKWRSRNKIPAYRWPAVVEAAKKRRYKVSYELLADLQKKQEEAKRAA